MENKQSKSWSDVKVDQYIEYKELQEDQFESSFDYEVELFQILRDENFDFDVEELDVEEFNQIRKSFNFRFNEPSNNIKYNIGLYSYIGMDELSFGNFIDLEYYFTNDLFGFLPNICAILWRKTKEDEWGNAIIEPYSNININNRIEEFKLVPITDVYGVINEYTKFKELFLDTYNLLFEQPLSDEGKFDEYLTDEDKIEIEKEEAMKKWSWESVLYQLADGDITKYDAILGLPLIFVFNQLSFKKSMNL
jgi:hypothetical protein